MHIVHLFFFHFLPDASALILTFLLNNYEQYTDPYKLSMALEWEETFIDFMKTWVRDSKPESLEVSSNSERSVEDEIQR